MTTDTRVAGPAEINFFLLQSEPFHGITVNFPRID